MRGILIESKQKAESENMGELKEQYLPKKSILNGVTFAVNGYEERKGKWGDEYVLHVTTETLVEGKNEFVASLWQAHLRNYVKNVLKTKVFGEKDFVGKRFSIKSVELSQPDKNGNKAYGFGDLVYVGELAEVVEVA